MFSPFDNQTTMKGQTTMTRGGYREGAGRKRQHPEGEPRPRNRQAVQISLLPDELEQLTALCDELGLNRSDLVRRVIEHGWLFRLTNEQLNALRSLAKVGDD